MTATKTSNVAQGSSPTWSVSATGFVSQSGTVSNIQEDTTLPIYLLGELQEVPGEIAEVKSDSGYTMVVLTTDNKLYGWGRNENYYLGTGDNNNVLTPRLLASNVREFQINSDCIFYINNSNELWGCGKNEYGILGRGDTNVVSSFTKLADNVKKLGVVFNSAQEGYSGINNMMYIDTNDDLYMCGDNQYGQQGSGSSGSGQKVTTFTKRASSVKSCYPSAVSMYIDSNDNLYECGYNGYGGQSTGNTINVTTFTQRASNVKKVIFNPLYNDWYFYLSNSDSIYGVGSTMASIGGTSSNKYYWTQVNSATNVSKYVVKGSSLGFIKNNSDFYLAGLNSKKIISSASSSWVAPTLISQDVSDFGVSSNGYIAGYIKNNGDLYLCGANDRGQQGAGNTTDVTYPYVKRASNVKNLIITEGNNFYINTDDELYSCGIGTRGVAGTGNTQDVLTFTKIKDVEDFKEGNCVFIKTTYILDNGKLYLCGQNANGQQGNGTSGSDAYVTTLTDRTPTTTKYNTASLTITPTPSDATVTINSEAVSSADIRKGMPAEWSVSKTGYVTQTGTIDHIYDDTTLTITLESE